MKKTAVCNYIIYIMKTTRPRHSIHLIINLYFVTYIFVTSNFQVTINGIALFHIMISHEQYDKLLLISDCNNA